MSEPIGSKNCCNFPQTFSTCFCHPLHSLACPRLRFIYWITLPLVASTLLLFVPSHQCLSGVMHLVQSNALRCPLCWYLLNHLSGAESILLSFFCLHPLSSCLFSLNSLQLPVLSLSLKLRRRSLSRSIFLILPSCCILLSN